MGKLKSHNGSIQNTTRQIDTWATREDSNTNRGGRDWSNSQQWKQNSQKKTVSKRKKKREGMGNNPRAAVPSVAFGQKNKKTPGERGDRPYHDIPTSREKLATNKGKSGKRSGLKKSLKGSIMKEK